MARSEPTLVRPRPVACQVPAPDLNPVEGIWSLLRRSSQVNTAFTEPDHLIGTLRQRLRQIQYCINLINGCLAETGLTLTTSPRQRQ